MRNKNDVMAQYSGQVDHTPPPQDPSQVLSPRRRTALVTYLAFLFALAFLFVALTMAMETKRVKQINEALEDSSQKTSASLTGSINALQEENRLLTESKGQLEEQLAQLEASLSDARETETAQTRELEELKEKLKLAEAEKSELLAKIEALTQQTQDAVTVSELLQKAIVLNESGNMTELSELLNQIAPMKDLLSPTEREIFESLMID